MNEHFLKAKKVINICKIFLVVTAVVPNISFFLSVGIAYGLYKTFASMVSVGLAFFMLNNILKGGKVSRIILCILLGVSIPFGIYLAIASGNITAIILGILYCTLYLAIMLYILFSKDIRILYKYCEKVKSLKWLYSWNGVCIGYVEEGLLWHSDGKNLGKFSGNEVYAPDGKYLCELHPNGRLGVETSKIDKTNEPYNELDAKEEYEKPQNTYALKLYTNFREFTFGY
ncbi:MAG TPA: hypothetical protein VF941_20505 [Clostridia bacterium]